MIITTHTLISEIVLGALLEGILCTSCHWLSLGLSGSWTYVARPTVSLEIFSRILTMSVNSSDFLVVFCWTEREKSETEMLRPMLFILNVDIFLLRNFRQTVWLNIFNWNSQTLLTNFRTFHHKHQHLDNNYTSSSLLSSLQRIVGKLLANMAHGFILLPTWAWKGTRKVERNLLIHEPGRMKAF